MVLVDKRRSFSPVFRLGYQPSGVHEIKLNIMEIERHISADRLLDLVVVREKDDLIVFFEGTPSHTHGNVLIGEYATIGENLESPDIAVRRYVTDILTNRMKIFIYRKNGAIRDISALPYETGDERKYLEQGDVVEMRYWDVN